MAKLAPLLAQLRGPSPKVARTSLPSLMGWKGTLILVKSNFKVIEDFKVKPGKSSLWHFGDSLTLEYKDRRIRGKKSIFLIDKDQQPLAIPEGVFYILIKNVSDLYKGKGFIFQKLHVQIHLEMIETE